MAYCRGGRHLFCKNKKKEEEEAMELGLNEWWIGERNVETWSVIIRIKYGNGFFLADICRLQAQT